MPSIQDRFTGLVGERIQLARKQVGLTQDQLSETVGFKDRQILSNIEAGKRKVSVDELIRFMEALQRPLDWFTDPYIIPEEKAISWRARRDSMQPDRYEPKARNLIAAFRRFHDLAGITLNPVLPTLTLTRRNTYEDAWSAAEGLVQQWALGETPATKLEAVFAALNIHVLHVDTEQDVSGAACHLPQLNTILINRNEPAYRRTFTAVHEGFHLMTWDTLPPDVIDTEYTDPSKAPRAEQLADNFAAALLMPKAPLTRRWEARGDAEIHRWIVDTAREFRVSGQALYYRLRNLGLLTEGLAVQAGVDLSRLTRHDTSDKPPQYSKVFVNVLYRVLDDGHVSVRKAASLLDCTIEDLEDLFQQYKMPVPFAL